MEKPCLKIKTRKTLLKFSRSALLQSLLDSTMNNNTIDVALLQELVQETIIENYISFATLAVLVHDVG